MKPILLIVILLLLCQPAHGQIPFGERATLLNFHQLTGGDQWHVDTGWGGPEGSECSWYAITCVNGRVVQISLGNNNLHGILPPNLTQLGALSSLILPQHNLLISRPGTVVQFTTAH